MTDTLARVPVTVVTGFLGSGKTTLLNHLLSSRALGRVAALVNDFGAVDIDGALVTGVADEVVQLSNGCVCCTINGDLYAAARRVLTCQPRVDRIVVETTGLADPLPVGLTFLQTDLKTSCALEAVVTVVDCANFALDLFQADAAMAQIMHADIVVLNKIDLVGDDAVRSLARRVGLLKPRARRVQARYGQVPLSAIAARTDEPFLAHVGPHEARHHLFADGFCAQALTVPGPLSASKFQAWLDEGLPKTVFRAKGLVEFDRPKGRYVFQLCGGRASFEPYDGPVRETRLVFIGRGMDGEIIRRGVEGLRVDGAMAAAS